jgi:endogenous inhibitor of DNA gyrase (YacG/DUF329 family)
MNGNQSQQQQQPPTIINTACPICGDDPIQVPYCSTSCGHVFCYYCIQSTLITESSHQISCTLCGENINRITRTTSKQ